MTDRPILFSAPMVCALLDGRKTQTRRLIQFAGIENVLEFQKVATDSQGRPVFEMKDQAGKHYARPSAPGLVDYHFSPRIGVGDRLWCRESWWIATRYSYGTCPSGTDFSPPPLAFRKSDPVHYSADGDPKNSANRHYGPDGLRPGSGYFAAPDPYAVWIKKPSIHMPRWASRITLIVTDVRIERLQDISEADAMAEGVWHGNTYNRFADDLAASCVPGMWFSGARDWYQNLWDSINGAGAWDANPWVAAYSFTVHQQNIDSLDITR